MNKQNYEAEQKRFEKKVMLKDKRKQKKMKMSGAGVRKLAQIIKDRN